MFLNKVSPSTLCSSNTPDTIYSNSSSNNSDIYSSNSGMNPSLYDTLNEGGTQYSQYSQSSLELFSQPFQFDSNTSSNSTSIGITNKAANGEHVIGISGVTKGLRDKGRMNDQGGRKSLSKYYMRYISSQSSEENSSTQDSGYHSYQSWKWETNEKNRVIDEVVKVTKECAQQIESSVCDIKESLKSDLSKQLLILQEHEQTTEMSFSDEQKQQLHELLTDVHSSYSTKDELIDMNRKLNECTARFDVLESQLKSYMISSQTRFDQLYSLIESLRGELHSIKSVNDNNITKQEPPLSNNNSITAVGPSMSDDCSSPEIDISFCSTVTDSTITSNNNNSSSNSSQLYTGGGPITRNKRKQLANKENEVPKLVAPDNNKRYRSTCNTVNYTKNTSIENSSKATNSVEDCLFLTSPPVKTTALQQEFQRSSEMQRRQAFIKTMVPGSETILKEIQSVIGRASINNIK